MGVMNIASKDTHIGWNEDDSFRLYQGSQKLQPIFSVRIEEGKRGDIYWESWDTVLVK